jgi:archaellin
MVLVAAIAAGVLVNTAGFLQESAEQTGQQAQSEVSDRLDVVNAYTVVSSSQATDINITVRRASGSDNINLTAATIQWISDDNQAQTTLTDDSVSLYAADDTSTALSGAVVINNSSKYVVQIDLTGGGGTDFNGAELDAGDEGTLIITTASGATTRIEVKIPENTQDDTIFL